MIYPSPSNLRPIVFSDNATLASKHFNVYGLLVVDTASKTLTLPTPAANMSGKASYILNTSSGALTLSGAFVGGASSIVMETKSSVICSCLCTVAGTYKWAVIGVSSALTGLSETIADTVGAMVGGNTETGVTVAYQDGDNTLDFAVAYGTGVTATATSSTSVDGSADTSARGDHQHGIGTHTHADSTHGGVLSLPLTDITDSVAWTAYTPTVSFSTATPTVTKVGRYCRVSNLVYFVVDVFSADGAGGTPTGISLPVTPADIDSFPAISSLQLVDTVWSNPMAYIDMSDGTGSNRIVAFRAASQCTDDKTMRLNISGFYEVAAT